MRYILIILVIFSLKVNAQYSNVVKINFTDDSVTYSASSQWNSFEYSNAGADFDLNDSTGSDSEWNLYLVNDFDATNNHAGDYPGIYEDNVQRTYWQSNYGTVIELRIIGVDDSKKYTVSGLSNRAVPNTSPEYSKYTIGSVSDSIDDEANTTDTVYFTNISPSSGILTIYFEGVSSGGSGHLNAIIIREEDGLTQLGNTTLSRKGIDVFPFRKGNQVGFYRGQNVTPVVPVDPGPIDFVTMYDGVCPTDSTRLEDYDCAQNDFSEWNAVILKDSSDYTSFIYVDFDAAGGGDGSYGDPLNDLPASSYSSNTAYLIKRGGVKEIEHSYVIGSSEHDILIGAYDVGSRPEIRYIGDGGTTPSYDNAIFNVLADTLTFRDLVLKAPGNSSSQEYSHAIAFRGSSIDNMVFNCFIDSCDGNAIFSFGQNLRVVNDSIINCGDDAVISNDDSYLEVSRTYIDNGDIFYDHPENPSATGGGKDCIQMENGSSAYDLGMWIHHNTLDKGKSGNKAAILNNSTYTTRCIIEFNEITCPIDGGYGGAGINLAAGDTTTIRYNIIKGSDLYSGSEIGIANSIQNDSVYGNIFYGEIDKFLYYFYSYNIVFANNVFYEPGSYVVHMVGTGIPISFHNNIVYLNDGGVMNPVGTSFSYTEENNLFNGASPPGNSFSGDADFVNPVSGDFTLQGTSDAIDAGTNLGFYTFDIIEKQITDGNTDCGAYEY